MNYIGKKLLESVVCEFLSVPVSKSNPHMEKTPATIILMSLCREPKLIKVSSARRGCLNHRRSHGGGCFCLALIISGARGRGNIQTDTWAQGDSEAPRQLLAPHTTRVIRLPVWISKRTNHGVWGGVRLRPAGRPIRRRPEWTCSQSAAPTHN